MSFILSLFLLVVLLIFSVLPVESRLRDGECQVCLKRIGQFQDELGTLTSAEAIEKGVKKLCKNYTDKADQRFCYYIGGLDDSATSLLRTISSAMMNHLPAPLICERLKKADGQICAVKYEEAAKPLDWATIDLNKMRVKELKHILDKWGEKCNQCSDKGDYISLINSVKSKYVDKPDL